MNRNGFLLCSSMVLLVSGIQTANGSAQFVPSKGFQLERPGVLSKNFSAGGGATNPLGLTAVQNYQSV